MAPTAPSVWHSISGLTRRKRSAATIGLVGLGLAVAISIQAATAGNASAVTWKPTATQADLVTVAALLEASSTIPSPAGTPAAALTMPTSRARALMARASQPTSWPSNVTSASYIGSYRQSAQQFLGGDAVPDNRAVLVLQMTGSFSVWIGAPSGATPYARGAVLIAVLDASTGAVLDFALASSANPLPNAIAIFSR